MMPSAFVTLKALPLTPNGKVDRRALPEPDMSRPELSAMYEGPRTLEEDLVAGIVRAVLGVERVGVHDRFFERGGHSVLATQVVSRVRSALGVEVGLRTLFEHPTVAGLVGELGRSTAEGAVEAKAPALVAVSRQGELSLSYAQQRLWFIAELEPESV